MSQKRDRIQVEDEGDIAIVHFVDKKILDEQNITAVGDQLFQLVDEMGRRKLLLNFKNVDFLSSAVLGKLVTLNRKVQGARGKLVLCNLNKDLLEVFKITRMDKLFPIANDQQSGLDLLG